MKATRDDFEYWLFSMDDELESLLTSIPEVISKRLDFSIGSLRHFEKWLLDSYQSLAELLMESEKPKLDRFARYVGETFRKNLGGKWNIDLIDKDNAYFGMPVIEQEGKWTECPLSMVTAATERRTGGYLEGILKFMLEEYGSN